MREEQSRAEAGEARRGGEAGQERRGEERRGEERRGEERGRRVSGMTRGSHAPAHVHAADQRRRVPSLRACLRLARAAAPPRRRLHLHVLELVPRRHLLQPQDDARLLSRLPGARRPLRRPPALPGACTLSAASSIAWRLPPCRLPPAGPHGAARSAVTPPSRNRVAPTPLASFWVHRSAAPFSSSPASLTPSLRPTACNGWRGASATHASWSTPSPPMPPSSSTPERVLGEVRTFVELEAPRFARLSSFDFGRKEQSPRGVGGSLSDID